MSNPVKWNASIMFPTDSCFTSRCLSAKFAPFSTGNVGITLEFETVAPETYDIAGQEVIIGGVKARTKFPFMTKIFNEDGTVNEIATADSRKRVFGPDEGDKTSMWTRFGLDGSKEDPENPNVQQLVGIKVLTQMSSNEQEERKTPNAEQLAKAKKSGTRAVGDIMKNPVTGKAMCKYWPQVDEIFGVAQ